MMILTACQQYSVRMVCRGSYRAFIEREVNLRWNGQAQVHWHTQGPPVLAWVNRSSWAVNCDVCLESIIIEPEMPFFCPNCCNIRNGGYARPVIWPEDRMAIEKVLLMRAAPETRNWLPTETLADLIAQNKERNEWREDALLES